MSLVELAEIGQPWAWEPDMSSYPTLAYSMKEVLRAGEALRGDLLWSPGTEDEIIEIFRIANSWRDSHAFPMQSIRQEMAHKMRAFGLEGITAGRIKRMHSIRKKLRVHPGKLNQMQDLGGCRAVLPSINGARVLIEKMRSAAKHELRNDTDYIARPKKGGYRCHHLIYIHRDTERRIEVQIRTRLQHSWATAVEAVGLFRQEDLKGGNGNPDWLRLFDLISSEFAVAEGCPESEYVPERRLRIEEIRDISKRIDAVQTLENLRSAVRQTDAVFSGTDRPSHYRIEYDYEKRTVSVSRHSRPMVGINENDEAERAENKGTRKIHTVYVEADKVEDLKDAYPNYFGDVQAFNSNLQMIIDGKDAMEFTQPPKAMVPPPPREPADFSWFRPGGRRLWAEPTQPMRKPAKPKRS